MAVICPFCESKRVKKYGEEWECLDCLKIFKQLQETLPKAGEEEAEYVDKKTG